MYERRPLSSISSKIIQILVFVSLPDCRLIQHIRRSASLYGNNAVYFTLGRTVKIPVKQAAIVVGKLLALYLAIPLFSIDLILMYTAIPRFLFLERAFVLSVLLVVMGAAAISIRLRSKLPMLFAVLCLSYSSIFLVVPTYSVALVGLLMLVASMHFVYANRFTEPLLAALPIVAGAWVFLTLIYLPFSLAWVNFATGRMGYFASAIEGIGSLKVQSIQALIVVPLLVMHFLAKKAYVFLFVWARSLRPNPSFHRTLRDKAAHRR